jgi:D-mannonate dehydratase
MKLRLIEGWWRFRVMEPIVAKFHKEIEEKNFEGIKSASIEMLKFFKELFPEEQDEHVIDQVNSLIETMEGLDESSSEEDFDMVLEDIYSFCDEHKIFLSEIE